MSESHTRYFLTVGGVILTVGYTPTEQHPDYIVRMSDAIDVTDMIREVDGMLECPITTNKHGVVVRAPIPEPDPVGNMVRCKAIIEAQSEAIYLDNPEYIPAGHSDNWLTKESDWHVARTGRFHSTESSIEQVDRIPVVLEDGTMEAGHFFHKEWFATESAVLTKDEEAIVGSAAAPGTSVLMPPGGPVVRS